MDQLEKVTVIIHFQNTTLDMDIQPLDYGSKHINKGLYTNLVCTSKSVSITIHVKKLDGQNTESRELLLSYSVISESNL